CTTSGRFSVIRATGPRVSYSTFSAAIPIHLPSPRPAHLGSTLSLAREDWPASARLVCALLLEPIQPSRVLEGDLLALGGGHFGELAVEDLTAVGEGALAVGVGAAVVDDPVVVGAENG